MNNRCPLLTIIIATKNRQKYAQHAVESILSIDDNRIELVIQDNSDTNDLSFQLSKYTSDKRLRYRYTSPPFSSIDNFNAGIELSTGEYICLIGDDDGINPEIIEATLWAKSNNVDALVGSLSANYRWAGVPDLLLTNKTASTLTITHFESTVLEPCLEESLLKLVLNGCTYYQDFSLPRLYHGIVRRECMEDIKNRTGAYLKGLSPDIYSSIALACTVNKVLIIDYPLTIPGVCAESTSTTEGQLKNHSKRLEDAPHFRDRGTYMWSSEVPRIYCVETIWADSGLAALREMNRFDLIQRFNRHKLYAYIISANRSTAKMVLEHMLSVTGKFKLQILLDIILLSRSFITGSVQRIVKRFFRGLMIISGQKRRENLNNLSDIGMAMCALEIYLKTNNIQINQIISKANKY